MNCVILTSINVVILESVGLSMMRNLMFLYSISDGAGLVFCLILLLISRIIRTIAIGQRWAQDWQQMKTWPYKFFCGPMVGWSTQEAIFCRHGTIFSLLPLGVNKIVNVREQGGFFFTFTSSEFLRNVHASTMGWLTKRQKIYLANFEKKLQFIPFGFSWAILEFGVAHVLRITAVNDDNLLK